MMMRLACCQDGLGDDDGDAEPPTAGRLSPKKEARRREGCGPGSGRTDGARIARTLVERLESEVIVVQATPLFEALEGVGLRTSISIERALSGT